MIRATGAYLQKMQDQNPYKNRYRPGSLRLSTWDYSWSGSYFVTICVKNRKQLWFGDIRKERMALNIIGCMVANEWQKTEKIRKNVKLDIFQIMPNHLHGIVLVENDKSGLVRSSDSVETPRRGVSTINRWQKNSLGSIVNQFKSVCTKKVRNNLGYEKFSWQKNYYEHIIRDEESLRKIRDYILYNPLKWDLDRNNPMSVKYKT